MKCICFFVLLLTGSSLCDIDGANGLNDEFSHLADKIPNIDKLPINNTNVPTAEDAEKLFKEKCKKLGANDDVFDKAVKAKDILEQCVKENINVTEIQQEVENAKPTGDLDIVFGKYCKKTPVIIACIKEFLKSLDPCLEEKEKANKVVVLNITESLIDFACFKDGDRIAMFIAEGGMECLSEKQDAVQACANQTIGKRIPTEMPTVENLPLFVIEKDQCDDLQELQSCTVRELEKCEQPTPANIVDALFRFIKKVTPCEKMLSNSSPQTNTKNYNSSSYYVKVVPALLFMSVLVKYL